jgi:hypothetical protein
VEAVKRTDEERLAGAPFTISVGGALLELRPLPRKKYERWAKALAKAPLGLAGLTINLNFAEPDGTFSIDAVKEALRSAAEVMAGTIPGVIADLVFEYVHLSDPSRSRDWFDDRATNEENWEAFLRLLEIEFPFYSRAAKSGGGIGAIARLLSGSDTSPRSPSTSGASTGTPSGNGPTKSSG